MSDDKWLEEPAPDSPADEESPAAAPPAKPAVSSGVLLIFAGAAVLGALVVMSMRHGASPAAPPASESSPVATLQAEIDAHREALNRELVASGRAPLAAEGEPVEEIAARLEKDAASLVALASTTQQTIAAKNREVAEARAELLESEKSRQSLSTEIARLTAEVRQARIEASAADLLRRDLAAATERAKSLADELAAARQQLSQASAGVPAEEHADLKRRFEETLRAKEFYEDQVKQLQAGSALPE